TRLAWLEQELGGHGFDLRTAVPLFAGALGIPLPVERYAPARASAEEVREQAIEGIVRIVFNMGPRPPLLPVVEALHWVDATTAEMLRRLAARAAEHPLLAVYTSRPRIEHDCGRPHIVALELGHLPDEAADEMIATLAEGRPLCAETARAIRA